jgi:hypothetical protein
MKEYYFMAINLNNSNAMVSLENHYNKLELFTILKNINNPNELIQTTLNKLLNDQSVNNLNNKIKYFKELNNTIIECNICYETKLNIPFECMHLCCIDCYVKLNKCYFCNK